MTNGSLVERDLLVSYSVDHYFAEVDSWLLKQEVIEEQREKNKATLPTD